MVFDNRRQIIPTPVCEELGIENVGVEQQQKQIQPNFESKP